VYQTAAVPAALGTTSFWVLTAVLVFAELRPVRIDHRVGGGAIVMGTMFAVAMLHAHGTLPTVLALAVASVISDTLNRLGGLRTTFNVSMYTLSVLAGAAVMHNLGHAPVDADVPSLLSSLAVGAVIFTTQGIFTAMAVAIVSRRSIHAVLVADWRFSVSTILLMVSLAPAVVVLAEHVLWLLPVLVVTGDHSTPSAMKGHSWHPVPVILSAKMVHPDGVMHFDERSCSLGGFGRQPMMILMGLALAHAGRLQKFGA
jgi:hypothetical protein